MRGIMIIIEHLHSVGDRFLSLKVSMDFVCDLSQYTQVPIYSI